ncbi:transposase [Kitasatospora sp. NBC_01302]|nr:transposase [Kitasatospora sp. NBC_01302]
MAGLSCFKSGRRSRMFDSFHVYRSRKGEKKGLAWQDYRDLLIRTRIELGGPVVLVWDNLRAHLMPPMREFIEASKKWLTVFQLPSYATDLDPQEGSWSLVQRTIGSLAAANLNQLAQAVKRSLKKIQYRPRLIAGYLSASGLIMDG